MSVNYTECMGFERTIDPIGVNNGYCSWAEGRWRVHVKSDSYRGTGHEVWQIESASNPGSCMTAGNFSGATIYPGTCQYSGSYHNKFEVFKSVIDGNNNVYQLKDIEAWENNGQHRCIVHDHFENLASMGSCNLQTDSLTSYWDAVGW